MCARRDLILDTESYYGGLQLAEEDTNWYSFITDLWTKVLIKTAPADLDFHYSAQQSWMNLSANSSMFRGPVDFPESRKPRRLLNRATTCGA